MIMSNDRLFYQNKKKKIEKFSDLEILKLDLQKIQDYRCRAALKNIIDTWEE